MPNFILRILSLHEVVREEELFEEDIFGGFVGILWESGWLGFTLEDVCV